MCQPTIFWHGCGHLVYTTVTCPNKPSSPSSDSSNHPNQPPGTAIRWNQCYLCTSPETEPIAKQKANQLTVDQLAEILDADITASGFLDMVTRFYARGAHKRFDQVGAEYVDVDAQIEAHVDIENVEKDIQDLNVIYGTTCLPASASQWLADLVPGNAFDLVLEELASEDPDLTVLTRNGMHVMHDFVDMASRGLESSFFDWNDDDFEAALDTFKLPSPMKSSPSPPKLESPGLSAASNHDQHPFLEEVMSHPSSMPMGQTVDAPVSGHTRTQSSPTQIMSTAMDMDVQEGYPSPIPLASSISGPAVSNNQHSTVSAPTDPFGQSLFPNLYSPTKGMGQPGQMQPGTPTKTRSPVVTSMARQPAPVTTTTQQTVPASPPVSMTFDMKPFIIQGNSKSKSKKKKTPTPKKTIRVITEPPKEPSIPAPAPATSIQTPALAPGDILQNYPVQDMMLQCQKVREAAGRRRVEEIKENKAASVNGKNGVLDVQGENVRIHK